MKDISHKGPHSFVQLYLNEMPRIGRYRDRNISGCLGVKGLQDNGEGQWVQGFFWG